MAKKTRRGRGRVSTHNAPSMQGMQKVDTWDLIDIVPIVQGSGVPGVPFLVQLGASVNGWYYDVR